MSTGSSPKNPSQRSKFSSPAFTQRGFSTEKVPLGYDSDVARMTAVNTHLTFRDMKESMGTPGGSYKALADLKNKYEFDENFAKFLKQNLQAIILEIPDMHGSATLRSHYKTIIGDIESSLLPLCNPSNDPFITVTDIENFVNTGLTASPATLTYEIANDIIAAATNAIRSTYNTVKESVVSNSFEYLTHLSAADKVLVDDLLKAIGLDQLASQSANTKLLDTLAHVITTSGGVSSVLPAMQSNIVSMFSEKSPEADKLKKEAQLKLDKLSSLVDKISLADAKDQPGLERDLAIEVTDYNTKYGLTGTANEIIAANLLTAHNAVFDPSKLTASAVLDLPHSLIKAESAFTFLDAALKTVPIDNAVFDKAYTALEVEMGPNYKLRDKSQFVNETETVTAVATAPSVWDVLGITGLSDISKLKDEVLPAAEPKDWPAHLSTCRTKYNLHFTKDDLCSKNADGSYKYQAGAIDFEKLLGLAPKTNFAKLDAEIKKVTGAGSKTVADGQIASLNACLEPSKHVSIKQFYDIKTQYKKKPSVPGNVFEAMGIAGIANAAALTSALTPAAGADPVGFCNTLNINHGLKLNPDDIVSVAGKKMKDPVEVGTMMKAINHVILPPQTTIKLDTDQACIAMYAYLVKEQAKTLPTPETIDDNMARKAACIAMTKYELERKIEQNRSGASHGEINIQEIKESGDRDRIKRLKKEFYPLTFEQAMKQLAVDLGRRGDAVNMPLKDALTACATGLNRGKFEQFFSQFDTDLLLQVSAELNSYAAGNRILPQFGNKKIIFQTPEDTAQAKLFTRLAVDLVSKSHSAFALGKAAMEIDPSMPNIKKLEKLRDFQKQRMGNMLSAYERAYRGSQTPLDITCMERAWSESLKTRYSRDDYNEQQLYQQPYAMSYTPKTHQKVLPHIWGNMRRAGRGTKTAAMSTYGATQFTWNTLTNPSFVRNSWAVAKFVPWTAPKWIVSNTLYGAGAIIGSPFRLAGAGLRTLGRGLTFS